MDKLSEILGNEPKNKLSDILEKVAALLLEEYGDDFKIEEGDKFVFSLKDCTLIYGMQNGQPKFEFLGDKVFDLTDMETGFFSKGDCEV